MAGQGRRLLALGFVGIAVLSYSVGFTTGVLLALVLTVALAVAPHAGDSSRDLASIIPVASALALAGGISAIVVLSFVPGMTWSTGIELLTFVGVAGAALAVAWRRGGSISLGSSVSAVAWVVPLLLAIAFVVQLSQPFEFSSRLAWSGSDFFNHSILSIETWRAGALTYDEAAFSEGAGSVLYPRGLHAVMAMISEPNGSLLEMTETFISLTQAFAGAAAVLAVASVGMLTGRIAQRLGLPSATTLVVVIIAQLTLFHPWVFNALAFWGFLTSAWVAVMVVSALIVVIDAGERSTQQTLVVLAVLFVGSFYLWQPVGILLVAVAFIAGRSWWASGRPNLPIVVGAWLVAGFVCVPLARTSIRIVDVSKGTLEGNYAWGPTVPLLALVVFSIAFVVAQRRLLGRLASAVVAVQGILLGLIGAFALYQGATGWVLPYYAAKMLWLAAVVSIPVVAALGALYLRGAFRWTLSRPIFGERPLVGFTIFLAPLILVGAVASPWWLVGVENSSQVIRSIVTPDEDEASQPHFLRPLSVLSGSDLVGQAVMALNVHPEGWKAPERARDDQRSGQILAAWGAQTPQQWALLVHDHAELCSWIDDNPSAVLLTGPVDSSEELISGGCPPDLVLRERWSSIAP